jgi:ActR/RegA family two-component response regulator
MKVLIIEDDHNKLTQLAEFMRERLPDAEIVERKSYQSGLQDAATEGADLILVDMTLPTYEIGGAEKGGRTRAFAGREIISQLHRRGKKTRAIVVTQFENFGEGPNAKTLEELKNELSTHYGTIYVDTVFYQSAGSKWRTDLAEVITKALQRRE